MTTISIAPHNKDSRYHITKGISVLHNDHDYTSLYKFAQRMNKANQPIRFPQQKITPKLFIIKDSPVFEIMKEINREEIKDRILDAKNNIGMSLLQNNSSMKEKNINVNETLYKNTKSSQTNSQIVDLIGTDKSMMIFSNKRRKSDSDVKGNIDLERNWTPKFDVKGKSTAIITSPRASRFPNVNTSFSNVTSPKSFVGAREPQIRSPMKSPSPIRTNTSQASSSSTSINPRYETVNPFNPDNLTSRELLLQQQRQSSFLDKAHKEDNKNKKKKNIKSIDESELSNWSPKKK